MYANFSGYKERRGYIKEMRGKGIGLKCGIDKGEKKIKKFFCRLEQQMFLLFFLLELQGFLIYFFIDKENQVSVQIMDV